MQIAWDVTKSQTCNCSGARSLGFARDDVVLGCSGSHDARLLLTGVLQRVELWEKPMSNVARSAH